MPQDRPTITPAMIEAGVSAMADCHYPHADPDPWEHQVVRIYQAMYKARGGKVRDIIIRQLGKLREKRNITLSDDDIVEAGRDIMRALGFNKDELRLIGEMRAMCPDLPAHKDTTNVGT